MEQLPGYGSAKCWKCQGAGQLKDVGRRRSLKGTRCGVCDGRGYATKRIRETGRGRVTKGPREGDENWIGPVPAEDGEPQSGEDLCCLSGRWRIFQRQHGHRYSTEDVVTAWTALKYEADCHIDLGCGVGSVLLFVAWGALHRQRRYRGIGIEAQADSWRLATRSIRWNGADEVCQAILGDFRTTALNDVFPSTDVLLVTGTPPYYPVSLDDDDNSATTSYGALPQCEESAGARYEFRGGVDAYCHAAALLLRRHNNPKDRFVCCEGGLPLNLDRVQRAARAAGLVILRRRLVVGREGKPPLFGVWVFALASSSSSSSDDDDAFDDLPTLVVRDRDGQWTPAYVDLLRDMAMYRGPPQHVERLIGSSTKE